MKSFCIELQVIQDASMTLIEKTGLQIYSLQDHQVHLTEG